MRRFAPRILALRDLNLQAVQPPKVQERFIVRNTPEELLRWFSGKECRRRERHWFHPWVGKIPWRSKWLLAPEFLPGKFHGQKSLADCSPQSPKESDTTERLNTYLHTRMRKELTQHERITEAKQ